METGRVSESTKRWQEAKEKLKLIIFLNSTKDFKAEGWPRSSSNSRDPVGRTSSPPRSGKSRPWTPSSRLRFPSSEKTFPRRWTSRATTSCRASGSHWTDIGQWAEPPPSWAWRRGSGWKHWGPWKPGGGRCRRWWWGSRTGCRWRPLGTEWTIPKCVWDGINDDDCFFLAIMTTTLMVIDNNGIIDVNNNGGNVGKAIEATIADNNDNRQLTTTTTMKCKK